MMFGEQGVNVTLSIDKTRISQEEEGKRRRIVLPTEF